MLYKLLRFLISSVERGTRRNIHCEICAPSVAFIYDMAAEFWNPAEKKSSVYDCTVEDVEYIYNKFSLYNVSIVTHSRHLVVAITFP